MWKKQERGVMISKSGVFVDTSVYPYQLSTGLRPARASQSVKRSGTGDRRFVEGGLLLKFK